MHDIGKIGIPDCVLRKPEHFDPVVLAAFAEHHPKFHEIFESLSG